MAYENREGGPQDFLGRGWKFPPQVDAVTGRVQTVRYEEDIAEAIRIILFTRKGERVMRPEFGSTLYEYIFSTMDYTTVKRMERELQEAIQRWEPRVVEPEVHVNTKRLQEGLVQVEVRYVVRTTNNPFNLVFPYYINEGV